MLIFMSRIFIPGLAQKLFIPTFEKETEFMLWKIVLVLGVLGILLGLAVTGVSIALPFATDGRTSWEEAMIGIVPGILVLIVSFLMFVAGLIFVIKNRKKKSGNNAKVNTNQFGS